MKPRHPSPPQQGFAAIAAMFLLVVFAALGAYMLSFSNGQQLAAAEDVQGSQAYWSARGGLEWAVASIVAAPGACPAAAAQPAALNGYTLSVSCSVSTPAYSDGGTQNVRLYALTSVATQGTPGAAGYIERSVSAYLEK